MQNIVMLTGKAVSSAGKEISFIDEIVGGLRVIQDNHQLSHRGKIFSIISNLSDVEAGAKYTYSFKTPENLFVHLKSLCVNAFGATARARLIKDATVTDEGSNPITINNLNDNSTNQSQVSMKQNPSYTGGTIWIETLVGGATSNQTTTGGVLSHLSGAEFILKPNTIYIIEIENVSTSDTAEYISLYIIWSELTSGLSETEGV